jgi:hypothetical protein
LQTPLPRYLANASLKVYDVKPFRQPSIRAYIDPAINKADSGTRVFHKSMPSDVIRGWVPVLRSEYAQKDVRGVMVWRPLNCAA